MDPLRSMNQEKAKRNSKQASGGKTLIQEEKRTDTVLDINWF